MSHLSVFLLSQYLWSQIGERLLDFYVLCGEFHMWFFLMKNKTLVFVKDEVKSKKNNKSVLY